MSDEQQQPEPRPINFVQSTVRVVTDWPERIRVTRELLDAPHLHDLTYDQQAGTLVFSVFNGGSTYALDEPVRPGDRGPWTATRTGHKITTRRP